MMTEKLQKILYDFASKVTDREGNIDDIDSPDFVEALVPIADYFTQELQQARKSSIEEAIRALPNDIIISNTESDRGFNSCIRMVYDRLHSLLTPTN